MRHHEYDSGECGWMLSAWGEKMTPYEFEYRALRRRRPVARPLSDALALILGALLSAFVVWLVAVGLVA